MTKLNYHRLHTLTEKDKNSIIASIIKHKFINPETHTIDLSIKRMTATDWTLSTNTETSYNTVEISIHSTHKKTKKKEEKYCYAFENDLEEIDELNPYVPEGLRKDTHDIMVKYISLIYRLVYDKGSH